VSRVLKKFVDRLTKPVEELDRDSLIEFCDAQGTMPIQSVALRTPIKVAGEVRSVKIVPRAGAPALEVAISDGRGTLTAVFLGRRKIAGVTPGRRLLVDGVARASGHQVFMVNPAYTILA
jgi:RecG-like helicase